MISLYAYNTANLQPYRSDKVPEGEGKSSGGEQLSLNDVEVRVTEAHLLSLDRK